ncbi:MAG: hypothetical protein IH830_11295 [Planctomycetes bacterium]|nr:hypothetical protein [Planctomycetota bacterium]
MRNRISLPFSARSRSSCGHALPALVMIATVVVMSQPAPADQIFADWDAGTPGCDVGVWTDMCWGNEPMPNNGNMGHTYVAGISDGNANVTMNIAITLDGLVIFGGGQVNTMIIPNSRTLTIVGGPSKGNPTGFIDINDKLLMQSTGGNPTDLKVTAGPDNSTLVIGSPASPGELRMSNHINNRIYGATGTETIIFGTDLTVGGAGQIGVNATTLINQGTILADQSNALRIDPNAGGMTNSGLMVARDGGLLQFQPGVYDNALGEIRAEDLSTVRFPSGAEITGGLMVAQSGGLFEFIGGTLLGPTVRIDVGGVGQVIFNSTVLNLTNDGVINHNNSATLHTAGQLNNTGNYFMNHSGGNTTNLIFDSDTVLDGGGVINMSNHINNRIYGLTGAEIFTNVDNTIRGSGQIGLNQTTLINQGTILADQSTELWIDPGAGGMTNSGTLGAENGALLRLQAGPFTTSGFVFALAGSTITRAATDYIQTAGSTKIDGTLILNAGGTVTLDGGILGGSGLVSAHVDNVAGTASPGSSPGTLNIQGDYLQTPTGTLDIELSASVGDLLAMRGAADLAGTLSLSVVVDDEPSVGQMFTIITAGSVTGVFDAVTGPGEYDVIYNPTDVVVTVLALPPNTADISGPLGAGFPDGCVDAFDLGVVLGAWCSTPASGNPAPDPPCAGVGCTSPNFLLADLSGPDGAPDGCVDAFDLAKILANWCSLAGGNPCGTCFP